MAINRKRKLTVEDIPPTEKLNPINTTGNTPAYRAKMRRRCESDKIMTDAVSYGLFALALCLHSL